VFGVLIEHYASFAGRGEKKEEGKITYRLTTNIREGRKRGGKSIVEFIGGRQEGAKIPL